MGQAMMKIKSQSRPPPSEDERYVCIYVSLEKKLFLKEGGLKLEDALVTLEVTITPEVTVTGDVTPTVTAEVTPIVTSEVTINKQTIETNQINRPLMGESELFNF